MQTHQAQTQASRDPRIERLARRRAGLKFGWLVHAAVFLAVNTVLQALAWKQGLDWARWPLLGTGIGLGFHGAAVLLALNGSGLMERMVQRERDRLAHHNRGP